MEEMAKKFREGGEDLCADAGGKSASGVALKVVTLHDQC